MSHDAGGELHRSLEEVGVARARVEHHADTREVLLLILTDDGLARPSPRLRMQVADGVPGPVGPHSEEVHRFACLRRERHTARLMLGADDEREPRHVGYARYDIDLHAVARGA